MADHTYVINEIVGTSTESLDQAIRNGIRKAGESLRNLEAFAAFADPTRRPNDGA